MAGAGNTHHDRISRSALEQLLSVKGEGDEWDFKRALGSGNDARVNLAKDGLALCNLPDGGSIVIGVTSDYQQIGLASGDHMDTSTLRRMVEKYIDGDYVLLAAEHDLAPVGEISVRRFGIIYFRRRMSQPVLAAIDGNLSAAPPLFRSGDILIRRGAQSIRANSGDVRRLLTSSVVSAQRVRAVDELWSALVEQRRLLRGIEFLYEILMEPEYRDVFTRPELAASLGQVTELQYAQTIDDLQTKVRLLRPHLDDNLYHNYRRCSALLGRIQWKAIGNRDQQTFLAWTVLANGAPDNVLTQLASEILPASEMRRLWEGSSTQLGTWRPVGPLIDAAETTVNDAIQQVLSGLA
jgi:hypothetical protein